MSHTIYVQGIKIISGINVNTTYVILLYEYSRLYNFQRAPTVSEEK